MTHRRPARKVMASTRKVLTLTALLLSVALVAGPFAWMLSTSLKPPSQVYRFPPAFIPAPPQWENYVKIFTVLPLGRFFANTVVTTGLALFARLIVTVLSAYALARLNFPGKTLLLLLMIGTMMIPDEVQILPNYILMHWLGWLDTYLVLIVPRISSVFCLFLMRQFFLTIPRDLEEAAVMDGCGYLRIILHVILPMSKPVTGLVAFLSFKTLWNDFMWPLIMTNSLSMATLQVGLALLNNIRDTELGLLMAASTIATAPVLIVFWLAQKRFVQTISLTGLNG